MTQSPAPRIGVPAHSDLKNAAIIRQNALTYLRFKDVTDHIPPAVITELHDYVEREYEKLTETVEVTFTPLEVSCERMAEVWNMGGGLLISSANNNSPLFPGDLNLAFRAIHDHIHLTWDFGCDYNGEYETWRLQALGVQSRLAREVLYSEIVLQACFFLYYGHFPKQKVVVPSIT